MQTINIRTVNTWTTQTIQSKSTQHTKDAVEIFLTLMLKQQ